MRALALAVCALALAGCRGSGADAAPDVPGLAEGADVLAYDLALDLDPASLQIEGTARLTVRRWTAESLKLGLDGLDVLGVTVDGAPVTAQRVGNSLSVPLPSRDTLRVTVTYAGVPEAGLFAGEHAGQRVVYTDSWPTRAAGWLPAVHHPADPARFSLALTVPRPWEVAATGEAQGVDESPEGRTFSFTLDGDAPVYTFAFAVADFADAPARVTEASGTRIRHYVLDENLAATLDRTGLVLETLASRLGPYPYASYATVQVPMTYAGMENAAAPFLRADLYAEFRGDGTPAAEEVNVHEAVHQWFGNDVVPADWRHLWLAEGPATYLTTVFYESADGDRAGLLRRAEMAQMPLTDARRRLVPHTLGDPADALTATVYQKGGCVLHLLRLKLGDAVFFEALQAAVRAYAERPLTTSAFREQFEQASGQSLGAFFAYWAEGTRIPRLELDWNAESRRLDWSLQGDAGTLQGLPLHLLLTADGIEPYAVPLSDGTAIVPGSGRPGVLPDGVPLDVRY